MRNSIRTKLIAVAIGVIIGPITTMVIARGQDTTVPPLPPPPTVCGGQQVGAYCQAYGVGLGCSTCDKIICGWNCNNDPEKNSFCVADANDKCRGVSIELPELPITETGQLALDEEDFQFFMAQAAQ